MLYLCFPDIAGMCSELCWLLVARLWFVGGYSVANTSKCWTLLTATALSIQLPTDIPDHEVFTASALQ